MTGFHRLCGRFRCVGMVMLAEVQKARNSGVYGVCGALCRLSDRTGKRRELRVHHTNDTTDGKALNFLLNGGGFTLLRVGKNEGRQWGQIVHVSFVTMGWEGQLGGHLGVH